MCIRDSHWMGVFDELRQRGVEDVLFVSMDGVSGLTDGLRAIFPDAVARRCLVHLVRNSCKYVPSKDCLLYTSHVAFAAHDDSDQRLFFSHENRLFHSRTLFLTKV